MGSVAGWWGRLARAQRGLVVALVVAAVVLASLVGVAVKRSGGPTGSGEGSSVPSSSAGSSDGRDGVRAAIVEVLDDYELGYKCRISEVGCADWAEYADLACEQLRERPTMAGFILARAAVMNARRWGRDFTPWDHALLLDAAVGAACPEFSEVRRPSEWYVQLPPGS